jgi:hypothetical protein
MKPLQLKYKKGCKNTVVSQADTEQGQEVTAGKSKGPDADVDAICSQAVDKAIDRLFKTFEEYKAEMFSQTKSALKVAAASGDKHVLKALGRMLEMKEEIKTEINKELKDAAGDVKLEVAKACKREKDEIKVALNIVKQLSREVQEGVNAIKEAKTVVEEPKKELKEGEVEELKWEAVEACRKEQEQIKRELNSMKVKMEEIHNNKVATNRESDSVETDRCSREVMINGLQYWKFSNEQRLYYLGATPEEQLAEEIRRLSRGRVVVTEVTMIRSRDNPGWGPVAAKVTVGSTDQKRELYRVVAATMRAGGRDGHAIARVSFRDNVPKDKLGCMKQLVETGRSMRKDKLIAAFRIVVRGMSCVPMLQVKDQSSRWSFVEE